MRNKASFQGYPILVYHGVTASLSEGIENFSKKHIDVDEFERQASFISENMNPIPLRKMVSALAHSEPLPKNSVAVSFDDCYKNIHDNAFPILKKYNIAATFFISTGFVGRNRPFWTDCIEHIINKTKINAFDIAIDNQYKYFALSSYKNRIEAVIELKGLLKKSLPKDRSYIIEKLKEKLEVYDNGDTVSNYLTLSWDDVLRFDNPPFYEVGGHTVNHEILSYLDKQKLHYEVFNCVKELNNVLNHPIDLFSYPEGQPEHFNEQTISTLKEAGIKICPTATYGFNDFGADPFYLKRIMVGFMGTPFPFG